MGGMEGGGGWGMKWINLYESEIPRRALRKKAQTREGFRHSSYRPFGVAVATWCSYKVPPCQENVHGAMVAVPGHAS